MTYMNDERQAKKRFVEGELQAMLRAAPGGCVGKLEYEVRGSYEVVYVEWRPELFAKDTFGVDVTADSLWAIAKDVMKAVAKRYE